MRLDHYTLNARLLRTEGVCIVLDRYKRLLSVAGSLVTVEAGMTLAELNAEVAPRGLALPILGSITAQTVAGAISTATHGGSLHHGSLSDCVEAIRIVKADGTVVQLDRASPEFPAAVVSMGLLGLLSTVTFRCVPAFQLQSRSSVLSLLELVNTFDEVNRRNQYVNMLYFPLSIRWPYSASIRWKLNPNFRPAAGLSR